MNLKPFYFALVWVNLLALFAQPVAAQITGNLKVADDPAVLTLNLETLPPLEGVDVPSPYRQLFLIFNDGQFYTADAAGEVFQQSHRLDGGILGGSNAEAVVFSKAIYSDEDGDPPPKIVSGAGPTAAAVPDKSKAVPDTALIAITPDHPVLVPDGRSVLTVSVRNPLDTSLSAALPYNGYLLLFHESQLKVEAARKISKSGGIIDKKAIPEQPAEVYIEQSSEEAALSDLLKAGFFDAVDLTGTAPGADYKTLRVFRLSNLLPGQEKHFFLPVVNTNVHYGSIPEGGSGMSRYTAVLLLEPGNFSFPQLSAPEAEGISKLGLGGLLEQGVTLSVFGDPSGTLTTGELEPAAYTEAAQRVRRSYDPNTISLFSCPCPDTTLADQKVLVKVTFENEGAGATRSVKVRIPLPDAIGVETIAEALYSVSAGIETMELERDSMENTLTVDFPNLRLAGTSEGKSYAARSGYFSFLAYTKPGSEISAIPPVQACIAFQDANAPSGTYNSEACTPPGKILAADGAQNDAITMALSCTTCEVPVAGVLTVLGMPLWLFLLLLLIVAGAILLAFYYEDWLG